MSQATLMGQATQKTTIELHKILVVGRGQASRPGLFSHATSRQGLPSETARYSPIVAITCLSLKFRCN